MPSQMKTWWRRGDQGCVGPMANLQLCLPVAALGLAWRVPAVSICTMLLKPTICTVLCLLTNCQATPNPLLYVILAKLGW